MFKDIIGNIYNYSDDVLKEGFDFLKNADFSKLDDGKHILSEKLYVNIQTYTTKNSANFEAHREYIDIQYLISGQEKIGVAELSNCTNKIPYDKFKDIEFLEGVGTDYILNRGEFMVLYPEDAHKPSISVDINNPQIVRKAVVKVKI